MSFSREARRVRDESLPLATRVLALRRCLQHYHPIGFEASFSFLESVAGNLAQDPSALLLALDLLTASRAAWQAELHAHGQLRRRAKRLGHRVPHPSAPDPNQPSHWYGAPREAALHAVWFWYSKGASADVDVHCLAAALVERGRFTAAQRAMFEEVHAGLPERFAAARRVAFGKVCAGFWGRLGVVDGTRDFQAYGELRDSLAVVQQMAVVVGSTC